MQMLAAQLRLKPDTPKHKIGALLPYKPARYLHKYINKIAVRNTVETHKNNQITYHFNHNSFIYSITSLCTRN
jgi:hypothetical protein